MNLARVLEVIAASTLIIYAISALITLLTPIYIFRGDIDGYLSLSGYSLFGFGNEIRSQMAESAMLYTAPIYASALFALASSLLSILRGSPWLLLSASGIAVMSTGILRGVLYILGLVASAVSKDPSHQTAAGRIIFQGTEVYIGTGYIASQIALVTPYVSLALAVIITFFALKKQMHGV